MDFAKKELEKYGWIDGKGLGRNEDGISIALKPKLKFDNNGIGHDSGIEFTNNWWERLFNAASSNIDVQVENDNVQVKRTADDSVEISTKNYSLKSLKRSTNLKYGSFVMSERLTEAGIENYKVELPEVINFNGLTDEELFSACGGRTAHKGARHGLKLSGKLSRIDKQEKMILKKMKNVSLHDKNVLEKKMKKIKKHKDEVTASGEMFSVSSKKKDKKKRKSVSFCEEAQVKFFEPESDVSKDENSNSTGAPDEGIEQDIDDNNSEQDDNHRSFEEAQSNINDLSKAERKKLKKKRKMEKNGATAKFLYQIKCDSEDPLNDDNTKKRKYVVDDSESSMELDTKHSHNKLSKKKKFEKIKRKKDKKMMNSIVQSLDNFCRISDDE